MTLGNFISGGLFLQTLGVVGLLSARRNTAPSQPAQVPALNPESQANCKRETLRKKHGVQLIDRQHEGLGFSRVPPGSFGWSYTPSGEAPLFSSQTFQSFEMHKSPDGTGYLIGFVTESDKVRIEAKTETLDVRLFPEPYGDATALVGLPLQQVHIRTRQPNRSGGNWLPVTVCAPE
jgi:hypothetical protein